MSAYLEAPTDPKEVMFEAGALIGVEEVLEMSCPDRAQGSLLLYYVPPKAGRESVTSAPLSSVDSSVPRVRVHCL